MLDLRLVLQCLKEEVKHHGQVDSDVILTERGRHERMNHVSNSNSIDNGPYVFKKIQPNENEDPRLETKDDPTGDALKQYEADVEVMNLILISIPNDIYNSVDACQTAQEMWLKVERLMQGTALTVVDRETRFNNEFDQFTAEPRESLVLVYNHFAQLMNDLKRNKIDLPNITINTKFLNCLQPKWLKYVTSVRLARDITKAPYDDLFDCLQQYEKIVIASRAKKLEKTHDPLALVAHTSSSRSTPAYYVTHPPFVVDYDDEYQGETFQNDPKDSLTSAMMLLARAITQRYSTPTNNRLLSSSNTRNQAVMEADIVNIQSRIIGNDGRSARRLYNVQEDTAEGSNVEKETENVQRNLQTSSSGNDTNVQCYNYNEKGHYARNCPKPRIRDSKYFIEQMLLAKKDEAGAILSNEQNDFLLADVVQMEELEEPSANICMMAIIQPTNIDSDEGLSYDYAFISEVQTPSTSYMNPLFTDNDHEQTVDHDKHAHDSYELEQLARNAYKEAEKQQMNNDEDKYLDDILNLEAKVKTNENVVIIMSQYVQALFMLGPKPLLFYDPKLKHALGYENPYMLKKAIAHNPKLYDASCFNSSKMHMNVCDTEEILEDATKSQIKMENKLKDPIAIEKKQNFHPIDYKKLNALYKTFVPQVELSAEQKYFSSVSMTFGTSSHASTSSSPLATMPKSKEGKTTMNVFELMESDLDATWKQNEILNDQLLDATLKYDVKKCVLICSDFVNDNLLDEIEKVKREFLEIFDSGCSKHMTSDLSLLKNFVEKFMGTIRFGNDHFAAITGYDDYVHGNITIFHVYYVEGLGHNLFSVGQFCDGACESNFYTISISDMAASSRVCLMSKATLTKSWLWHRRLSHLNFSTINDLTKQDLVDGLPKFKYDKDHLCFACERGKTKKAIHPSKMVPSTHSKLELIHMDLCGPMRVESINGKSIFW
ncbi:retrovirus-related pol polyprotein from transposon TNT 1-94 [Tanacetum coccineum]|uniref:Retrovirus-related pol polyprotein from transposon TNT 1-94 n=1 Tax=Tanacetum coccineum TaxID=301880 RepID=A0ABQ5J3C1_9ASTR